MRGARPERALDAAIRSAVRFARGARVCVACSGGPDSVALASLLDRLARDDGYDLVLAHVNHGVRLSAAQDECVVLSVGGRLGRRVLVARPHVDVLLVRRVPELGEPEAVFLDEIDGEPVAAGRDRPAHRQRLPKRLAGDDGPFERRTRPVPQA